MAEKIDITVEYIKSILDCDTESGTLKWKHRSRDLFKDEWSFKVWNNRFCGKNAGCLSKDGYIRIRIYGKHYLAHRLLYFVETGNFVKEIDHINKIRSDNRILNLREATRQQNGWNRSVRKDSSSGVKGVVFHPEANKWRAQIKINGKTKHIGLFASKEDAGEAFAKYAKNIHGEFWRDC